MALTCYPSSPGKFFSNELSLKGRIKRVFYRKPETRIAFRIIDLTLTFALCLVYVIRVLLDDHLSYQCDGEHCSDSAMELPKDTDNMAFSSNAINWYLLVWVQRPLAVWIIQLSLSFVVFLKGLVNLYISPQGTRLQKFWYDGLLMNWICTLPYLLTLLYPFVLRHLFLPGFLACWLVRRELQGLLNDLHLTKQRCRTLSVALTHQLTYLLITLSCLIFTTMGGIQHIQRGSSGAELTMFESLYFVIVTFSTVGYGDISPDTWLGQLFMTIMICLAFAYIPRQVEGVTTSLKEMRKLGGEYSQNEAHGHHHVVLCTTSLSTEAVLSFLVEFYAHPHLEDHTVVLLSTEERHTELRILLKDPKWAHRVIYMMGSVLNDADLQRCRMTEADACFLLPSTTCENKESEDQLTLLHSWAVRDFAPYCRQYIQLFNVENKMHVGSTDHVVCAEELKYAILANSCLHPGVSTLITLLLHSTTVEAASMGREPWQLMYGSHSTHSVYHIELNQSKMFGAYRGWNFPVASADAHKRYGVCLLAVQDRNKHETQLQFNPGNDYKLRDCDRLFYVAEVPEEQLNVTSLQHLAEAPEEQLNVTSLQRMDSDRSRNALDHLLERNRRSDQQVTGISCKERDLNKVSYPWEQGLSIADGNICTPTDDSYTLGSPPPSICTSSSRQCHVMKTKRQACCLEWDKDCEHCTYKNARHNMFGMPLIILAAEHACTGMDNFLVTLRSHTIDRGRIHPIVFLLQHIPSDEFIDNLGHFPMVFWMQGAITNVDDVIRAGVHKASHLVVTNLESSSMADSKTLVAVQTLQKFFPGTNIITELNQASNIRFLQCQQEVVKTYTHHVATLEKRLRDGMSSTLPYLFRLPFAAGKVFSASLLDSLLYQTYVKQYLITFVRLLVGVDTEDNSGCLGSIRMDEMTSSRYTTFGELYYGLVSTSGKIPIAIYRSDEPSSFNQTENNNYMNKVGARTAASQHSSDNARNGPRDFVCDRLRRLGMDTEAYVKGDQSTYISYVILNPSPEDKLLDGDMVYIIHPATAQTSQPVTSPENDVFV